MSECKCTLRETAVGDGCRYCNPQFLIDHLADERDEQAVEIEQLQDRVKELEAINLGLTDWEVTARQWADDWRTVKKECYALLAERDHWKSQAEVEAVVCGRYRDERDALKAENEALRKDAERYRWVRSQASPIQVFIYGVDEGLTVNALDEALDRDIYGEADDEGEA